MDIGKALRKERLDLGLTQQQMCEGILSRPFYAKVESGQNRINAESLFRILFKHQIDITEFGNLIQKTYITEKRKIANQFEAKMNYAVSTNDIKSLEIYVQQIMATSDNEVLKMRALITLAYFKGELDKIDAETKKRVKAEFDEGRHWLKRPELLRLLANTMPLWTQDELDFLIGRLLDSIKNTQLSELMLERYLRLLENYLVISYERKVQKKKYHSDHVNEAISYIINATKSFHFMIYRVNALYMRALFSNDEKNARKIKESMIDYGYKDVIANWPV